MSSSGHRFPIGIAHPHHLLSYADHRRTRPKHRQCQGHYIVPDSVRRPSPTAACGSRGLAALRRSSLAHRAAARPCACLCSLTTPMRPGTPAKMRFTRIGFGRPAARARPGRRRPIRRERAVWACPDAPVRSKVKERAQCRAALSGASGEWAKAARPSERRRRRRQRTPCGTM